MLLTGVGHLIYSLVSTANLTNLVSTSALNTALTSTVIGLGTAGYLSSAQLLSTTYAYSRAFTTLSANISTLTSQKKGGGWETPRKGTLKTRTSSPSDHWQFWKRTIRRQESGLEPGTNHTGRYTHRRGTGCGKRPQWAALPLSYPVTYVQLEYPTRVTNVSFSYTIYH